MRSLKPFRKKRLRHWFRWSTTVSAVALTVALSACGDEVTDPDGVLASAEAEAVMRSAGALPALPELLDRVDPATTQERATLYRARELWAAGAALDDARGGARRRLAARYAAPILADALSEEEWADVRTRIDDWHATAEGMLRHIAMPAVDGRLQAARRQLDRATASPSPRARAYHLLLAASELVETTPRFVARALTAEAEAALRRVEAAAPAPSAAALERAHRLKDWAVQAVEEEDYLLAIQRAYYAIQLVEGR